jgi:hypothetical protein
MTRISLKGSIPQTSPKIFIFKADGTFDKTLFPEYTNYDVITIGGGGGRGGGYYGIDSNHATHTIRTFGGEGGGGGFHRVRGLLSALDATIDYTVGVLGAAGVDKDDLGTITDGADGTASIFGGFASASGGKGGKKSISDSLDDPTTADGGDGGLGGQGVAGYGAKGGIAGIVDDPEAMGNTPGTNGEDGYLREGPFEFTPGYFTNLGLVGAGGGGGTGGGAQLITGDTAWSAQFPFPTSGGVGSYDIDELVYAAAGVPTVDPDTGLVTVSGKAGGARATPITNSWTPYGNSGHDGIIVLRLTVE